MVEGKLTHDTELIGKMDIYVKFTHNGKTKQTKVLDNIGKNPKWEDTSFDFLINEGLEEIKMEVLDKDVVKDDLVGATFLQVDDLRAGGGSNSWQDIHWKGKLGRTREGGSVNIITKWTPANQ